MVMPGMKVDGIVVTDAERDAARVAARELRLDIATWLGLNQSVRYVRDQAKSSANANGHEPGVVLDATATVTTNSPKATRGRTHKTKIEPEAIEVKAVAVSPEPEHEEPIDDSPVEVSGQLPQGPYDVTPMGNAERFTAQHAGAFLFVTGWGWMRYEKRWRIDDAAAREAAKRTVASIKVESRAAWKEVKALGEVIEKNRRTAALEEAKVAKSTRDAQRAINRKKSDPDDTGAAELDRLTERARALTAWAKSSQTDHMISEMLHLASSDPVFNRDARDFDRRPDYLNTLEGTVDLRDGNLMPHRPDDMLTQITAVRYMKDATSTDFDKYLATAFLDKDGNDRPGLMEYMQELAGYSATGHTNLDILPLVEGVGGSGKTTGVRAVQSALGEYAHTMRIEALTAAGNSGHNDDIAQLAGKRLVVTFEPKAGERFDEGRLKLLTGGEHEIAASFKGRTGFKFRPQFTLWVVANEMPYMSPEDTGIRRRASKLPYDHVPEVRDETLRDRLSNKVVNREAVLAWVIAGAVRWYAHGMRGIKPPPGVVEATEGMFKRMEKLTDFFADCLTFAGNDELLRTMWVSSRELNLTLRAWAAEIGMAPKLIPSPKTLASKLEARGCLVGDAGRANDHGRTRGIRGVILSQYGLDLLNEWERQ